MPEHAKKRKVIKKKKPFPKHVVVFQDGKGAVLKTCFVSQGKAAEAPAMPEIAGTEEHYTILFDGWDQDYSHVTENMVIKPLFRKEAKKYLVMYFHENGSMLGMESVAYGKPAPQTIRPVKESDDQYDYPFIGWNCALDHIEKDTNAKAIFGKVRKIFIVHFYHEDGRLLKTEKVHYDEAAHPPVNVTKDPDPVYHYQLSGWSYPVDHIRESLNIHAVFDYIYNEYRIRFFDGEELVEEQVLHYGDVIEYPSIEKKGYDLAWDKTLSAVSGGEEIRASWTFSNPVSKIIESSEGRFRIMNPSIHHGTVSCLAYQSKGEKKVHVPASVRLGDYYYEISDIGAYAFKDCSDLQNLILPDTVKTIADRGLAGCRSLRKVTFGKRTSKLGKGIFAGNAKLHMVVFRGSRIKHMPKETLQKAPTHLEISFM